MKWALIALGALVVALVILEVWGRRQPTTLLVSRAALRHALELLRARGVDGTALLIRLPEQGWELVLRKRVEVGSPVYFVLRAERVGDGPRSAVEEGATEQSESEITMTGRRVEGSTDDVIHQLDEAAVAVGSRLLPNSHARFSGPVLAFNIPDRTGSAQ